LWLLPPSAAQEVNTKLSKLISSKIPSIFPDVSLPHFAPHITLATGLDESVFASDSAQAWLESLDLSTINSNEIEITFAGVKTGSTFTKKCYLQVRKPTALEGLAKQLQVQIFKNSEEEAMQWVKEKWDPHLSLL
jgi:2'-5' RNA ligase